MATVDPRLVGLTNGGNPAYRDPNQATIDPKVLEAYAAGQDIGQFGYQTTKYQPGRWDGGESGSWVNEGAPIELLVNELDKNNSNVFDTKGNFLGRSNGMSENAMTLAALTMLAGGAYGAYSAVAGAGAGAGTGLSVAAADAAVPAATWGEVAGTLPNLGAAGTGTGAVAGGAAAAGGAGAAAGGGGAAAAGGTAAQAGGAVATGWDLLGKVGGAVVGTGLAGAAADGLSTDVDTSKLDQLVTRYLASMDKFNARSDEQWTNYMSTWRPIETKLADTALNYDTPARREQAANEAMGGVASQFDLARTTGLRDLQSAGVDPSTIAALGTASLLEEAKAKAGAANTARSEVESKGLALIDNAARFGQTAANSSLQLGNLATGQGANAGTASVQSSNLGLASNRERNELFGDLLGAGLKAVGMFGNGG